ncbi:MAG: DUF2073 domain-containing protein [Methanomicrobium sp.]|nr:DUF2073 domain-containing protein [Methanomicrobium sp.]MBO4521903.1 DUF2073 domain-containing protein [Methanomicrobium sp.]MBR6010870.1 DUF2073 domain-containing protein [Methanomicrobium sp.]MBR6448066.1 DUF2073 domain-containing protein [Methanomicrobium sp.]MBR6497068.1 DUF2073 domain-containing protein [Methanomicrobium sp.]
MIQGVQIDLISSERLENLTTLEKVRLILEKVMEGNVVVLEKGLTPDEQSFLIETTMREITPDGFAGIEMETYSTGSESGHKSGGLFGGLFGKKDSSNTGRLTVIGPANQMKTLKKDKDLISTWVSSK